jgi:hypothetical protein
VAERAQLVRIDDGALARLARTLARVEVDDDEPLGIEFAVTFGAVNFGSGWHPHLSKLPGKSGNVTLGTRLRERFDIDGPFTAEELADLMPEDCARVFGQQLRPPVDELMVLFARSLNDLGAFLLARFDGSFHQLVEEAGDSAARLVGLLLEMPMYRDVAVYDGRTVPLLKRAQLTASDIGRSTDSYCFNDLDRLTVFADNLVPHVLRVEGVLRLDAELASAIDAGELLPAGGEAEVELRAAAVECGERMASLLGGSLAPRRVDNLLWRRGQAHRFTASPRPRVRTCFY